ncbi:hypothetical protein B9Z55_026761 [Caenorhabditis nigoni]|uniref:HAT C-terminal dimerisation domain-containing protein n=1 Tax=Caenorhabditis nigoni TaxID=1611254 RepID=A0A2G5SHF0_9PELO|nr:hypothetical protein B9Z55_026761 [Caenorhabditis nigoni]
MLHHSSRDQHWEDAYRMKLNQDMIRMLKTMLSSCRPTWMPASHICLVFCRGHGGNSLKTQFNSTVAEMSNYKAIVLSGRPALDSSPLLFWHAHRDRFPILQKMGQHFLACTQSSAIVERLFSVCGCIVNNSRRNRMKSSTLNLHLLNASLATLQAKNEAGEMNEYDECEQSDSESEENRHEEISGEFNDDIFEEALARAMTI